MNDALYLHVVGSLTLAHVRRAVRHDYREPSHPAGGIEHVLTLSEHRPPETPELVTVTARDLDGNALWTGVAPSYETDTVEQIVEKARSLRAS
jgi:hypothetical protein